ncbi:transglycosylase family protein [Rothia sp. LK2588]|uniref:transglycosylase family protein n=1 Tax=Rothia sp. LK2588 TaxID=3114369 RepID=UPI0034CFE7A9
MKKTSIRRNVTRSAVALAIGGAAAATFAGAPANAVPTSTWDALAQCESGGNWGINTGNGFSGGLQFTPSTWAAFGGQGSPTTASKAEQIRVAENVLAGQGWGAWPACSAKLGLYGKAGAGVASAPQQQAPAPAPKPAPVAPQANTVKPVEAPAPAPAPKVVEAPAPQAAPAPAPKAVEAPAPVAAPAPAPVAAPAPAPVAAPAPAQAVAGTYVVKAGDTLSEIAVAHGIYDWTVLANANAATVPNPNVIEIGQVLNIPAV